MSNVSFVRQLGAESGVQLNPLVDNSELATFGREDQIFAIALRATRGRIDRAFRVDGNNVKQRLGYGESLQDSALNEAWIHVVEALNYGAMGAVVARLHTAAAVLQWIVVRADQDAEGHPTGHFSAALSTTDPSGNYLFAVKHLDCFNDGIKVSFRADELRSAGANVANPVITLRLIDSKDETVLSITGSLDPTAKDDYGNAYYLPVVAEQLSDSLEIRVGSGATVAVTADAYGYLDGVEQWWTSPLQTYFTEGGMDYQNEDYVRARTQLYRTTEGYGYIASGGSQAPALLMQMAGLAFDTARQFRMDVPGTMTPDEGIAFVEQLNISGQREAHLIQVFWSPLKCSDPTGLNGKRHYGTATLNVARACARNAVVNAKGFAPKNYPIAGRDWPLPRTGIEQTYTPTNQELSALAKAKINPVLYDIYSGGGLYVWKDSLTSAPVENSLKKLIAVAEMSSAIDHFVTRYGKDVLQLPMTEAIKRMRDTLTTLFEGAQASGWLIPSAALNGAAWQFTVQPNAQRPYDLMDVSYTLRYDGTTRQIHVTQILSRP